MKNITENKEVVNQFVIDMVLVEPVEKIIENLNNNVYRDCDVSFLNTKIKNFINFALETLNVNILIKPVDEDLVGYNNLNDHTKAVMLKSFNVVLAYFKTL